ncbi:hypothetical protein YPPY03_0983, partial [Yersinia pestis PY-03]
MQHADIP